MRACYVFLVLFLKSSIVCSDGYTVFSFDLVDGMSPNEGRIEVEVTGDDGELKGVMSGSADYPYTINEANWVCKERGYMEAAFRSEFGSGQPAKFFYFDFDYAENDFEVELECDPEDSGDCNDEEAAGVICQKPGYLGCYQIRRPERGQIRITETRDIGNNDACLVQCRDMEMPTLFAAQREETCLCFNNSAGLLNIADQSFCDRTCTENDRQRCGGGGDHYTIFNVSAGFCSEISGTNLNVDGGYRFGDVVRANCSGGLRLMGDDTLQCIGGPDFFDWNGTIPSCIDATTVEPTRATDDPARTKVNMVTGGTVTRFPWTGTGFDERTDVSTMVSVVVDMNARSVSKSLVVQVAVPVVGVLVVAVMAILLVLYIIRTRKIKSETKQDFQQVSPKSTFSNNSYNMHSIPNNDEPSHYEVRPNPATEGTNVLIDNVLYKAADTIRRDTNKYELAQDSPNDAPRYGLVDNVLYKPVESIGDPHSNNHKVRSDYGGDTSRDHVASDNLGQLPIDSEYACPDEIESRGRLQEGGLVDNILYNSADNQVQKGSASRKYYEIKPGSVTGHRPEVDHSSLDNGRRYYDIQPQPSHSPQLNDVGKYNPGPGYDTTELETTDGPGPRFVIKAEPTSPKRHDYAGVDNGNGKSPNGDSNNTSLAGVKQKPFPRYAKVQK